MEQSEIYLSSPVKAFPLNGPEFLVHDDSVLLTFKLQEMALVGFLALRATGTNFAIELSIVLFVLVDPIVWLPFRFLPAPVKEQSICEAYAPLLPSMVSRIVWLMGVNLDILTLLE